MEILLSELELAEQAAQLATEIVTWEDDSQYDSALCRNGGCYGHWGGYRLVDTKGVNLPLYQSFEDTTAEFELSHEDLEFKGFCEASEVLAALLNVCNCDSITELLQALYGAYKIGMNPLPVLKYRGVTSPLLEDVSYDASNRVVILAIRDGNRVFEFTYQYNKDWYVVVLSSVID